ncbi:MAG: apolipoprotein N-acyltransferase [Planctomycetota bacterium]|nr:apolipoprotein N-acyltransferase [Planctomycetota bacterium]
MRTLVLFLGSAVLRGLAQPGWLGWPLLLVAAPLRILCWRQPARLGWDYAHGVLFWVIAFSFLTAVSPIAPLSAAILLGLTGVVEGWLARRLARWLSPTVAGALALATAAWLQREWFLIGAGGVPWASWAWPLADSPLLRAGAVLGESGLIVLVVAFGGAIASGVRRMHRNPCWIAFAVLLGLGVAVPRGGSPILGTIPCLAVQGNIRVKEKAATHLDPPSFFLRQLDVTEAALERGAHPRLIVWAETMWPFPVADPADPDAGLGLLRQYYAGYGNEDTPYAAVLEGQRRVAERALLAAPADSFLITGAHFYRPLPPDAPADALSPRSSESVVFGPDGQLLAHLPKSELVPFGERLPFWGRLPFARALTDAIQSGSGLRPDFARPPGAGPLRIEGIPALGMATCWENVFDGVFRRQAQAGAQAFLVLSNEDWYGDESREMVQMVAISRLRAVETGRAILRVTNTGHTVLVRADGSVLEGPPPGIPEAWEVDLPWVSARTKTPFLAFGWLILPILAALGALLAVAPKKSGPFFR